ncbi:MAG: hypothetical protein SPiBPW_21140 [Shewanella algae]
MHCKGQFGGRNPWAVACLKDKNMNNFIFLVNVEAVWAPRGTVVSEAMSMDNFYILQMATNPI